MHKPLKRLWFHPHLFIYFIFFFLYQGFISQTLAIHRTAGEVRRPPFITLYHFQPLTNIQAFVCNLHMRWLSRIFNHNICVYQTATQRDLPPYWITIWLIDWLIDGTMFVCLLDDLILIKKYHKQDKLLVRSLVLTSTKLSGFCFRDLVALHKIP